MWEIQALKACCNICLFCSKSEDSTVTARHQMKCTAILRAAAKNPEYVHIIYLGMNLCTFSNSYYNFLFFDRVMATTFLYYIKHKQSLDNP